jgi:hypothetical protein
VSEIQNLLDRVKEAERLFDDNSQHSEAVDLLREEILRLRAQSAPLSVEDSPVLLMSMDGTVYDAITGREVTQPRSRRP